MTVKQKYTSLIKHEAHQLGFNYCGISKAEFLEAEAPRLEKWLKAGMQGEMTFMERWIDKRLDPRKLLQGARSVVSLMYSYHTNKMPQNFHTTRISKYAYGRDYHKVLKKKLKKLLESIRAQIGEVNGRAFVDSAPVWERVWAARSGLGWIGKNCILINRQQGSFFFLAELILDIELEYDHLTKDLCADCDICVNACPTGAIVEPYLVDGSKCISYLTIELKGAIPEEMANKINNQIFGCDICQDVCPFNRKAIVHQEASFEPHPDLLSMKDEDWNELTEHTFNKLFTGSVVRRIGFEGLKRNIALLKMDKERL